MTTAAKFTKRYLIYTTILAVGVPLFFLGEYYFKGPKPASSGVNDTVTTELTLPNFDLTNSQGQKFSKADLFKRVSLVNFVFSSCPEACPLLMEQTRRVADDIYKTYPKVQVVSLTVDPNNDTIEELADWKESFKPDPINWQFLGGRKPAIEALVRNGFKLPVEESPDESLGPILHSFKVVLVDHFGKIRGFYEVRTKEQRQTLVDEFLTIAKAAERIYPSH